MCVCVGVFVRMCVCVCVCLGPVDYEVLVNLIYRESALFVIVQNTAAGHKKSMVIISDKPNEMIQLTFKKKNLYNTCTHLHAVMCNDYI